MALLLSILLTITANAKPITIAVIDTGYNTSKNIKDVNLCKYGHKDFVKSIESVIPKDHIGHGTNVAHIINNTISKKISKDQYCLVILRGFLGTEGEEANTTVFSNKAIQYAIDIGISIINFSGGGIGSDEMESRLVKKFLDNGGIFVAAAGNRSSKISTNPLEDGFYPALADPRVIVVGGIVGTKPTLDKFGHILNVLPQSNYGPAIDRWENGLHVCGGGKCLTGTSQSTATATGKITIEKVSKRRKREYNFVQ